MELLKKILNFIYKRKNEYDENNTKEYTIEVTNIGDGLYVLHYDKIIEKKISNIAINIDMPKNAGETKIVKITYGR